MRSLIFLLALLVPASAQETLIREVFDAKTDTHVEVLALFTHVSHGGFMPVRVKIANNQERSHSVDLAFESSTMYSNKLQTRSSFEIGAPAGKTVTRDILVPLSSTPSNHTSPNLVVRLGGSMGSSSNSNYNSTPANRPAVLMSEALFTPNASILDAESAKHGGYSRGYGNHSFSGKFDPKQLPDDWLAYSGFDSVMMTENDWSVVPAGGRNAILSWLRLGGQLVIYHSGNATLGTLGIPEDSSFGIVALKTIGSDLKLDASATVRLVDGGNPILTRGSSIINNYSGSWPLQTLFGPKDFNYGLFIAVLILFGILVGPINLFLLAKSGQRHRLFITTPLISLGASILLVGIIIFQDGFGGNGVRRVLMEVRPDQGGNSAYLHQEQFSRTGILTSGRFTVDPACFIVPVPIAKSRWSRYTANHDTSGTFDLQPRDAKLDGSGDWWQSRSEHGHALSAVIPTRGRIERTAQADQMVSTFDFPIETLFYLDASKQWHRAETIRTGAPFTLVPVDATFAEPALIQEVNGFTERNRDFLERARKRTGHFVAITSEAKGIATLPGIRWKKTRTIITGPIISP
jgi:hypothetical protein